MNKIKLLTAASIIATLWWSRFCANSASSLSSFARAASPCTNPAARSIWPMMG